MTIISLRQFSDPINQQVVNDCAENADTSAIYYQMAQSGVRIAPLNKLSHYGDVRDAQGNFYADPGTIVLETRNTALDVAMQKGIPNEPAGYYTASNMYLRPTQTMIDEASSQKVTGYSSIGVYDNYSVIAQNIGKVLSEGKPVIATTRDFYGPGTIHTFVVDGIDYQTGLYHIKNSAGPYWGDAGYGTLRFQDTIGKFQGLHVINGFTYGGQTYDWNWTDARETVAKLYLSGLKRAPEFGGIDFWDDQIENGDTPTVVANRIFASNEAQIKFGNNADTIVNNLYDTLFERDATVSEQAYYRDFLDRGYTIGDLTVMVTCAVDSYTGSEQSMVIAATRFDNRVLGAQRFAITMQAENGAAGDFIEQITDDIASVDIALMGVTNEAYY